MGYYGVSQETGLTEDQVKRNRELYGENGEFPLFAGDEAFADEQPYLKLLPPRCSP